ncbi:hypothetical protein [uncultured Gammaproteobacteria bacterium]|jgi:hypothetical protein|nr:hypothetical protein [uncultured Gammaproteobacteria bacterium]CAC9637261.1 hypothetical protein [uncultured Gammaproteobacteria bacterium]
MVQNKIVQLEVNDITKIVEKFEEKHDACGRDASFDYCYNYFHPSNKNDLTKNIEQSCLSLGFYLASWGMFRGSSFMLKKSSKHFEPLVEYIASVPEKSWHINASNFEKDGNIDFLIEQYNKIKEILIPGSHTHLTLVTKVMLGVFASVPAYDYYFTKSFKNIFKDDCKFGAFSEKSLQCICKFHQSNQSAIDKISLNTVDFISGEKTDLKYTNSKIIDMYGFTKGLEQDTL